MRLTTPYVGLTPTTPHSAAGWRIDPPVSLPKPSVANPAATAAALPPARTARHPRRVERVARRTERRVLGARSHGELVEVGLADDHRPGVLQPRDDGGVVRRLPSLEDPRRAGRRDPAGAHVVLERHRDAGERAGIVAGDDRGVDRSGGESGLLDEHEVEGVDLLLAAGDRRQVLLEDVDGAALARPNGGGDLQRVSFRESDDRRDLEPAVLDLGGGGEDLVVVERRRARRRRAARWSAGTAGSSARRRRGRARRCRRSGRRCRRAARSPGPAPRRSGRAGPAGRPWPPRRRKCDQAQRAGYGHPGAAPTLVSVSRTTHNPSFS